MSDLDIFCGFRCSRESFIGRDPTDTVTNLSARHELRKFVRCYHLLLRAQKVEVLPLLAPLEYYYYAAFNVE